MITLAYMRDFPPFTQQTSDGPTGLAINRVRAALAAAGIEATFKPVDLPEAIPALTAGVVDAIAATGAAPERADVLSYSDPLLTTGGAWFLRAGTQWPADGDLEKPSNNPARVVTPENGPLLALMRKRFPGLSVDGVGDYAEALTAVATGTAAAAGLNKQAGAIMAERDFPGQFQLPARLFYEIALALAVPAGDPLGLLAPFNAALATVPA